MSRTASRRGGRPIGPGSGVAGAVQGSSGGWRSWIVLIGGHVFIAAAVESRGLHPHLEDRYWLCVDKSACHKINSSGKSKSRKSPGALPWGVLAKMKRAASLEAALVLSH